MMWPVVLAMYVGVFIVIAMDIPDILKVAVAQFITLCILALAALAEWFFTQRYLPP
jgi:hypothetical protein